jgi:hypothetical protein
MIEPTNDHEREIARIVDAKATDIAGKLDFSIVRDVVEALHFIMSRSDSQFLVRYVQWRRDQPASA